MIGGARGVGIFVDADRVYAIELRREFGEIHVTRSAEAPYPDDPADDPITRAAAAVTAALDKAKISGTGACLSFPEREALIRYFEMPLLPNKERESAARFEAQKYLPYSQQDLHFSQEITLLKRTKKLAVTFAGIRRRTLDPFLARLGQKDVKPAAVEASPFSLVRSLRSHASAEGTQALISRESDARGLIVFFRQSSVVLSRTVEFSLEPGAAAAAEQLVSEFRLALNFFAKNSKGEAIRRLTLSPESDPTGAAGTMFRTEFGLEVAAPDGVLKRQKGLSGGMRVAAGAALRGLTGDKRHDFMPRRKAARRTGGDPVKPISPDEEKEIVQRWAVRALLVAITIGGLTFLFLSSELSKTRKMLQTATRIPLRTETASSTMTKSELDSKEAELMKRLSFLSTTFDQRASVTEKLSEVARLTPPEIRLVGLNYSAGENTSGAWINHLRLEGTIALSRRSAELATVNRFTDALKGSPVFMHGFREIRLGTLRATAQQAAGASGSSLVIECSSEEKKA